MTTLREAAQRLLGAVCAALPYAPHRAEFDVVADTADDLRAALAQEPAISMNFEWVDGRWLFNDNPIDSGEWCVTLGDGGWMIYPAPPQRKPLTGEEIIDATEHIDTSRNGYFIDIARAVERAHGIGEQE